jgi:hypothetical protein
MKPKILLADSWRRRGVTAAILSILLILSNYLPADPPIATPIRPTASGNTLTLPGGFSLTLTASGTLGSAAFCGANAFDPAGAASLLLPQDIYTPILSATSAVQGTAITVTSGTWTNFPSNFLYQWRSSTTGTSAWSNESGATANSYTPGSGDVGNWLQCAVAAVNPSGTSAWSYSTSVSCAAPISNIPGLMAYWTLNETGWEDSFTNGWNLSNTNGVTTASGLIGNCASFNGADYLGFNHSIGGGGDFTISFWAKGGYSGVFLFSEGDGIELTNTTIWAINSTLTYFSGSGFTFPTDTAWHWVCVINNSGASTMTVYIDNVQVDSVTYSGRLFTSGSSFLWGCANDGYNQGYGTGLIDEAAVFNLQLNPSQMTQLYNSGAGDPFPF